MHGKLLKAFLLFLLISTVSCGLNDGDNKHKGDAISEESVRKANLYEDIHRLIYDNPSAAREKARHVMDSLPASDKVSRITLLKHIGSSHVFETNYPEGIRYYNEALKIAEEIGYNLEIANINNNLGVIFNEIGNYKLAYIYLAEALSHFDLAEADDKKIGAYNNMGLVYLNLRNYDKALTYFEKALDSTILNKDTILVISVLNNIALCHTSGNKDLETRHDLSLQYLHDAIELAEKVNNKYGLCISYQLMGNLYLSLNDTSRAYSAYNKSTAIAEESNLPYQLAISRLGTAKVLLKRGKTRESHRFADGVMVIADSLNSLTLKSDAHLLLSEINEAEGNYHAGLNHYREHIMAQEEIISQTVIHQIYDVELNDLSQLNTLQQLELDKKELTISKKNNLLFFMALIFILLIIGLYLIYLNHRHRQQVKLQKTILELNEKKSTAALEAEIQERKRIGQELHDSLGHLLSLAGLHASMLQKRDDISGDNRKELLDSLMKTIDDAFDEVRNISHNLAPSLLSERGLKGALKSISDRVNQTTGLKMSFDTYGLNGKLDNLIENTLFRTIQEIVSNTIKHSGATSLFIQITQGNEEISLMAEDNGKGFDYEKILNDKTYGLSYMKSRIENLNGTMFIDSNPGRGTIVNVLIPGARVKSEI